MKRRTSRFPLGQLLLARMEASGLTLGNFSRAIGYGSEANGVRAIDALLSTGRADRTLLARWRASAHAPEPEAFSAAIAATQAQREAEDAAEATARAAEERADFRPFFQAIPEHSRPSQITLFGLVGGHRRHTWALPEDFAAWARADQEAHLAEVVPKVHAETRGQTCFMGRALGYRVWRTYDGPALRVSEAGAIVGEEEARWLHPGQARVSPGFRFSPPQVR
jgi:hypothetical protein